MITAAIIVLREVFEAALIIGIVLAGTRGVPRRGLWVCTGVAAGALGAVAVAAGAGRLAAAFEGNGQDLFNAGILLLATAMLGWHNVWMRRHGRGRAREIQSVGEHVTSGRSPRSALFLVVMLAVLREGSEVVLFLYGVAAGGATAPQLWLGSLAGLLAGVAIGAVVYLGLARVPQRHLFAVTGALLLLIAAGMAAQAAGYLVQAGLLPALADPLWDSSRWLPERGPPGQLLHALTGYVERPSGMQLVFFVSVAAGLLVLTRRSRGAGPGANGGATAALAALVIAGCLALPAPARAGFVIYSPVVEGGEYAFEERSMRAFDSTPARAGAEEHKLEFEHAPTTFWLAEGLMTVERDPGGGRRVTELSAESVFELTPQGKYRVDTGLLVEYAHRLARGERDPLEIGLLAETAVGRAILTGNLTAEGPVTDAGHAQLSGALRARWRLDERFEPGVEWFGELGEPVRFGSPAGHRQQLGPSAYGRLRMRGHRALLYQAAWVFGLTGASPDSTARLQLEYEF